MIIQFTKSQADLTPTEAESSRKGEDVAKIKEKMASPLSISDVRYLNFDHLKGLGLPSNQLTSIYESLLVQFPTVYTYELISSTAKMNQRSVEGLVLHEFNFDFKIDNETYTAKGSYQSTNDLFVQFYQGEKLISTSPYSL